MSYAAEWYLCDIVEAAPDEPDWSRVPEARRAVVRERWHAANAIRSTVYLWGPQIEFFQRFYTVSLSSERYGALSP